MKTVVTCKHFAAYGKPCLYVGGGLSCGLIFNLLLTYFLCVFEYDLTQLTSSIFTLDLDDWNGTDRFHFNAIISPQDLVEVTCAIAESHLCAYNSYSLQTYLPGLEACVKEGNVASIMCGFNAVNGVPNCANKFLQNTIVREQWVFEGYIVRNPN